MVNLHNKLTTMRPIPTTVELGVQAHLQDPEVAKAIEEVSNYHAQLNQSKIHLDAALLSSNQELQRFQG